MESNRNPWAEFIGESPPIKKVQESAALVAKYNIPVLITGATGTGKELIAKIIHTLSGRQGQFVPVNCGAIPETLLESELFGHEKGAFTDARQPHKGKFQLADQGTIFLDEITETTPSFQVKLLRVLQNEEFYPVGGEHLIKVNARVIAATNLDSGEILKKIRKDLFYRLNVWAINLPSLNERREDIPFLVSEFLRRSTIKLSKASGPRISEAALEKLVSYDWPGNVRQLETAITRAMIKVNGRLELTEDDFELAEEQLPEESIGVNWESVWKFLARQKLSLKDLEYYYFTVIEKLIPNTTEAALVLGIGRRSYQDKQSRWHLRKKRDSDNSAAIRAA